MKKITLLVTAIFAMGGLLNAAEAVNQRPVPDFMGNEPIVFIERGIEFFVFADGQFDFNTRPSTANAEYLFKSARRQKYGTYGAPAMVQNINYGVLVEHDDFGRVRRIGNVFLNYDAHDRIKRIGSVYMSYNRYALAQVGGMALLYNNRGQIIGTRGTVNGRRPAVIVQNHYGNYQNQYGYSNPVTNDSYYYKPDGTKLPIKR